MLGDGAEVPVIAELTGLPPEDTIASANALTDAGVFGDDAAFTFTHPLIADAAGDALGVHERSLLHLRAARALSGAGAPIERICSQLLRAPPTGDPAAVGTLREAAADAMRRGAPGVAATYLRRALAEPPPIGHETPIRVALGLSELACGEYDAGTERLAFIVEDSSVPASTVLAAAVGSMATKAHGVAAELLRAAATRDAVEPDGALQLRAAADLIGVFFPLGERPTIALPPAHALAAQSPGERLALAAHAWGCCLLNRPREHTAAENGCGCRMNGTCAHTAADYAERGLANGTLAIDVPVTGWYFALYPIDVLLLAERLEAAERESAAVEQLARRETATAPLMCALVIQAHAHLLQGRTATAASEALQAVRLASLEHGASRERLQDYAVGWALAAVLAHDGAEAADRILHEHGGHGPLPGEQWNMLPTRALVHLGCRRLTAALDDVQAWRAAITTYGAWLGPIEWHLAPTLVLLGAGDVEQARAVAADELAHQRAWGAPGRIAAALRVAARAEPERALDMLDEAQALVADSPLRLERARVNVERGMALRRHGARRDARAALEHGAQLAAECQARPLAELARSELVVLGARPRRLAFSGVDALTASERRVAELAAEGVPNREIAQQLFVTLKTVEFHLGNAYRKVGVSSRKDLPAVLTSVG